MMYKSNQNQWFQINNSKFDHHVIIKFYTTKRYKNKQILKNLAQPNANIVH